MRSGLSRFGRPKVGPGSGGVACNLGISGEFPAYTSGSAYTGTVTITGGTPPYTVELITESTPGGGGGAGGGSGGSGPGGGSGGGLIPSGTLYGGYVNTPYLTEGRLGEGFTAPTSSWNGRTAGLPENITGDGQLLFGYPTAAGTSTVTITGGALFGSLEDYVRSITILPAPSFTVLSPFDRDRQNQVARFDAGPAPYLQVTGLSGGNSRYRMVRGINGLTSGKVYFEVTVTTLPSGGNFWLGIDASAADFLTTDPEVIGDIAGQWGYQQNAGAATARAFGSSAAATAAAQGDVVCVAADLSLGRMWVRVNGGAWIGGGDPAANTTPTFTGMAVAGGSFWGNFRPCVAPGIGTTLTANFGGKTFAQTVPSGFAGWPWAQVSEMRSQVWESDRIAWANGDPNIYASTSLVNPTGRQAVLGLGASVTGYTATVPGSSGSIVSAIGKSTGKWQFEVESATLRVNRCRVGLVDATFTNTAIESASSFPIIGDASATLGVLPNSTNPASLLPGFPAKVYVGGAEVGSFTEITFSGVLTFACDFDAGTVAIYTSGALGGTFTLPSGVKPWRIGLSGFSGGGVLLRTSALSYPVATFTNWGP